MSASGCNMQSSGVSTPLLPARPPGGARLTSVPRSVSNNAPTFVRGVPPASSGYERFYRSAKGAASVARLHQYPTVGCSACRTKITQRMNAIASTKRTPNGKRLKRPIRVVSGLRDSMPDPLLSKAASHNRESGEYGFAHTSCAPIGLAAPATRRQRWVRYVAAWLAGDISAPRRFSDVGDLPEQHRVHRHHQRFLLPSHELIHCVGEPRVGALLPFLGPRLQ